MPMNTSGQISLGGSAVGQSINLEIEASPTAQVSLNDLSVRQLAEVPNGQITMPTNFYGKENTRRITLDYTANTANLNIVLSSLPNYLAGKTELTINIADGVYIFSNSTGSPALSIGGGTAGDVVTLNNRGFIIGMGGAGGAGGFGNASGGGSASNGVAGSEGGTALNITYPVNLFNYNTLGGGGGGGGGGHGNFFQSLKGGNFSYGGGGGGGGRTGITNSAGGAGGAATGGSPDYPGAAGGAGTVGGAGGGGAGGRNATSFGLNGGNGGAWGAVGDSGQPFSGITPVPGGAAGFAYRANGNVLTISVAGTILGPTA